MRQGGRYRQGIAVAMQFVDKPGNNRKTCDQRAREHFRPARVKPSGVMITHWLLDHQQQIALFHLHGDTDLIGCLAAKWIGKALLDKKQILRKMWCQQPRRACPVRTGDPENMAELVMVDLHIVGVAGTGVAGIDLPDLELPELELSGQTVALAVDTDVAINVMGK